MERRLTQSVARVQRAPDGIGWWRGLTSAADGAFAITGEGRITLWNPAAERITGHTAAEVVGRHCYEVFAGRDASGGALCAPNCRLLTLIRRGDRVESFDLQTSAKGGRPTWLNMSTVVMPDAHGRGSRGVRIFRDVTPVKDLLALIRSRFRGVPAEGDRMGRLTRREPEVLRLMASGATNRALAEQMHLSPATVRNHTHNIFEKLGVPNRLAAVTLALGQFLI